MAEQYLETDEQRDVLVSLEEFGRQLNRVVDDVQAWKFAIVALMFAVNGALTCLLTGTMGTGAFRKDNAKQMTRALQKNSTTARPEPYLAGPMQLLLRAQGKADRFDTALGLIEISERQSASFELLVEFRNQFSHFSPTSWSIEVSGLPMRCMDCLEIVEKVAQDGWALRHLRYSSANGIECSIEDSRNKLKVLRGS